MTKCWTANRWLLRSILDIYRWSGKSWWKSFASAEHIVSSRRELTVVFSEWQDVLFFFSFFFVQRSCSFTLCSCSLFWILWLVRRPTPDRRAPFVPYTLSHVLFSSPAAVLKCDDQIQNTQLSSCSGERTAIHLGCLSHSARQVKAELIGWRWKGEWAPWLALWGRLGRWSASQLGNALGSLTDGSAGRRGLWKQSITDIISSSTSFEMKCARLLRSLFERTSRHVAMPRGFAIAVAGFTQSVHSFGWGIGIWNSIS